MTAFQIIMLSGVGAAVKPSLLSDSRLKDIINYTVIFDILVSFLPFEIAHKSTTTWCGHYLETAAAEAKEDFSLASLPFVKCTLVQVNSVQYSGYNATR